MIAGSLVCESVHAYEVDDYDYGGVNDDVV